MQKHLCDLCKHYFGTLECEAFKRIPNDILIGNNNHSKIQKGQKGKFIFTPNENG